MEVLLLFILPYLISLAANERTAAIHARRESELKGALSEQSRRDVLRDGARSLRDELRSACIELARSQHTRGISEEERPLWRLLSDDLFQADLVEWLMAGDIAEGEAVKQRLSVQIEQALIEGGASPQRLEFVKAGLFEAIDKTLFSHPILARWRHQQSLDYLREQVATLRALAERLAGQHSEAVRAAAVDNYRAKALKTWDIIDLGNLPEGDVHIVTQQRLLRQLYIPLRITIDVKKYNAHTWEDPASPKTAPIGELLAEGGRLVILGDPGGGKTTLLRWLATAYLLRHGQDAAYASLPDTDSLPDASWIPVLIRCRDLGADDLCRSFADFVTQHLRKSELSPEQAEVMRAVVLEKVAAGEALLLVDGLDEITDPRVRVQFCQELERTAARYPLAPIIATSRIVGYREMPYRMGAAFRHGTIADLDRPQQDEFAARWIAATEQHRSAEDQSAREAELVDALHSSNRIESLARNPMLLTTLALVKRKVGKLPSRRTKLYQEAVGVLLNWNPLVYDTIEEDEAFPQLEYVAYELCRRGVQRIAESELLALLDRVRAEYPNVRAIRRRSSEEFLQLVEARSSILIKVGALWAKRGGRALWEFRHLTFQEYLAARALIDGRFPGRERGTSLAEQIAPLAGPIHFKEETEEEETEEEETEEEETEVEETEVEEAEVEEAEVEIEVERDVPESWREALRLVTADCLDDDVDEVILAILNTLPAEPRSAIRPRAILATLCLADEPNVSPQTAERVLKALAQQVSMRLDGNAMGTPLDQAAQQVSGTVWASVLECYLFEEYCCCTPDRRHALGGVLGSVHAVHSQPDLLVSQLRSRDRQQTISAALTIMTLAYERTLHVVPGLFDGLMQLLGKERPEQQAAAWALGWLSTTTRHHEPYWCPSTTEIERLSAVLAEAPQDESDLKWWLIRCITEGKSAPSATMALLSASFRDGQIPNRRQVLEAIVRHRSTLDATLLSFDADWNYPEDPIPSERVPICAAKLGLSEAEVCERYEALAAELGLQLDWV